MATLLLCSALPAGAQVWQGGGGDQFWSTGPNWIGNASPASNGTAAISFSSGPLFPIADAPWDIATLSFSAGAASFAIDGAALTIRSGVANASANLQLVENDIALGGAQTWTAEGGPLTFNGAIANAGHRLTLAGSSDLAIHGALSGTGGIRKTGAGTLTLGSAANSFGGGTELVGGVVSVEANAALGNAATSLSFNGGTLEVTGTTFGSTSRAIVWGSGGGGLRVAESAHTFAMAQALSGAGRLTKSGPGTLLLFGVNTFTGATVVSEGALRLAGGSALSDATPVQLANASGVALDLNHSNEAIGTLSGGGASGGNVQLGTGTLTVTGGNFAGVIGGVGGKLVVKTSALHLSGANTFTGGTTIQSGGSIRLQSGGALGAGPITVIGSGIYDDISNGLFFVGSDTLGGVGATPAQAITIQAAGFITSQSSFTTLGAVTLNAGIIETDGGANATHQAFFLRGTVTVQANAASSAIRPFDGAPGVNAGVHLLGEAAGGTTFQVAEGAAFTDLSVTNALIDAPADAGSGTAGRLVKAGAGTMALGAANTFSGATIIEGGTLEITVASGLGGTGSVRVDGGGTLLLSGSAGNRIRDGASVTLAGGTLRTSGLSEAVETLTLTATSVLDFAGGDSTLRFADSHLQTWTGQLQVWNWADGNDHLFFGNTVSGLTSGQADGIQFFSGSGNGLLGTGAMTGTGEVALVAVPEPATVAGAIALISVVAWREKRRFRRSVGGL